MKNKLIDLNNILFEQLERLNDTDFKEAALGEEIERSRAMTGVARHIIENARLALDAAKAMSDGLIRGELPKMIGAPGEEKEK